MDYNYSDVDYLSGDGTMFDNITSYIDKGLDIANKGVNLYNTAKSGQTAADLANANAAYQQALAQTEAIKQQTAALQAQQMQNQLQQQAVASNIALAQQGTGITVGMTPETKKWLIIGGGALALVAIIALARR